MRLTLTKIFSFVFIEPYTFNWVAAAIVGGALISGAATKKGAETGSDASAAATAEERRQFDLQWDANSPFRKAGVNALGNMETMLEGGMSSEELMNNDPGYQWRLEQGQEGVDNMLSGQNRRMGGSAIKAIADYNQGSASQEYQNIFNRNSTVAGFAPAANQVPQNQISSGIINQGNVQAGKYSAYNNAIQGGIQNYLTYDAQQNSGYTQPNTSYSDGSSGFTPNQSSIGYWDQ